MALRRLPAHGAQPRKLSFDSRTDIASRSSLVEFTVRASRTLPRRIMELYGSVRFDEGEFLSVGYGTVKVSILTNERLAGKVERSLRGEKVTKRIDRLGAIFISIPDEYRQQPGFFYVLTRSLAARNISVLSISNVETQVVMAFSEKDMTGAYAALYDLIKRGRHRSRAA
jgi:aspartokinase